MTPHFFLSQHPHGAVVRVSCTLKELQKVIEAFPGPALARAGSGVCYGYFERTEDAALWLSSAVGRGWKAVMEFSPEEWKPDLELWPAPSADFELTCAASRDAFRPVENLLNRGRLYRRI